MSSQWVDFGQLKRDTPIGLILDRYGIELRRSGDELRGKCPLPTHTSKTSTDSFSVNPRLNVWSCMSASCATARSGRNGGTVIDLVALMEKCSTRDAALRLLEGGLRPPLVPRAEAEIASTVYTNMPLGFVLREVEAVHPYLKGRGFEVSVLKTFGIGYYGGPGLFHGRVVIPIHNERHRLMAYSGRSVNGNDPKYLLPYGFRKSQLLFNLARARTAGADGVVVTEGFFDAVAIHSAGYRNVVSLMGSSLSEAQEALLRSHFRRAVLMLDGDEAGQRATAVIKARLTGTMDVRPITLPQGLQPDRMSGPEIKEALSGALRRQRGLER